MSISTYFGSFFLIASVASLAKKACSGVSHLSISSAKCSGEDPKKEGTICNAHFLNKEVESQI